MGEVNNAPKLRFSEFHNKMEYKTLGDCTIWKSGGTPKKDNPSFWNGNIPWISASEMRGKYYDRSQYNITTEALGKGSKLAKKGSLLLLVRGSMLFNKIPVGIANVDLAFNQDVKSLLPKENILGEYLFQWFQSNEHRIMNLVVGTGIGAGKLDTNEMQSLKIQLPTLPEQTKIANFLTTVDAKIANLNEEKSLLENYKKGAMQKIFPSAGSGQAPELRFKQDDGSDFPEWVEKTFSEVIEIGSGRDYKHLSEGDIPVYGTGGLMTNVNEFLFEGKSVCIGRKGTIDKPMFLEGKFWTVDTLFYTHSFKDLVPEFLFFVFLGINWQKYNEASGVPSLSKRTIESIKFECPSIAEQTKIANFLTSIDEKINTATKAIEKAQEWKKGLLQQLFI